MQKIVYAAFGKDLDSEIQGVLEAIEELNDGTLIPLGHGLTLAEEKTDLSHCDLFLGVLWTRFDHAEEFYQALGSECYKLFFFCNYKVTPDRICVDELKKLFAFRDFLDGEKNVQYHFIQDPLLFKETVKQKLYNWFNKFLGKERKSP